MLQHLVQETHELRQEQDKLDGQLTTIESQQNKLEDSLKGLEERVRSQKTHSQGDRHRALLHAAQLQSTLQSSGQQITQLVDQLNSMQQESTAVRVSSYPARPAAVLYSEGRTQTPSTPLRRDGRLVHQKPWPTPLFMEQLGGCHPLFVRTLYLKSAVFTVDDCVLCVLLVLVRLQTPLTKLKAVLNEEVRRMRELDQQANALQKRIETASRQHDRIMAGNDEAY